MPFNAANKRPEGTPSQYGETVRGNSDYFSATARSYPDPVDVRSFNPNTPPPYFAQSTPQPYQSKPYQNSARASNPYGASSYGTEEKEAIGSQIPDLTGFSGQDMGYASDSFDDGRKRKTPPSLPSAPSSNSLFSAEAAKLSFYEKPYQPAITFFGDQEKKRYNRITWGSR